MVSLHDPMWRTLVDSAIKRWKVAAYVSFILLLGYVILSFWLYDKGAQEIYLLASPGMILLIVSLSIIRRVMWLAKKKYFYDVRIDFVRIVEEIPNKPEKNIFYVKSIGNDDHNEILTIELNSVNKEIKIPIEMWNPKMCKLYILGLWTKTESFEGIKSPVS